jgi:hypothetical protein
MIKIIAIETNKGYYCNEPKSNYSDNLKRFLFNGLEPQPSFQNDWILIPQKPVKISHMVRQPNINYRFILKDDSLKSKKLPLELKPDKVGLEQEDCENNKIFVWNDEWAMYRSLYQEVSDPQPDLEVCEEFEFNVVFKLDELKPPPDISYPANEYYDRWINNGQGGIATRNVTNDSVDHQILDRIIFPKILIHETPCRLSSKQTYEIVRNHIKRYIDNKYAQVTSDYNFCFEVAKIVPLELSYTTQYERTPRGRRKPIVETRLVSSRQVKIFEMTNDEDKYKGYTVIEGFEAKTEAELKNQIDAYLSDLITYINEPLVDCPHCQGKGVLLNSKVEPVTTKHS